MTQERAFYSRINCNEPLALIAEKGWAELEKSGGKIPFEKLPPEQPKTLLEVLHELYSDGAGI